MRNLMVILFLAIVLAPLIIAGAVRLAADEKPQPAFEVADPVTVLTFTAKREDGTIGYGINFGPRDRRASVVFWNECGIYRMEYTIHGDPVGDVAPYGPVVSQGAVDITQMIELLREHDTCVTVMP